MPAGRRSLPHGGPPPATGPLAGPSGGRSWGGLLAGLVLLAGVTACEADQAPEPSAPPPTPTSTPLASIDTSALVVPRATFCARVSPADAQTALGGEVASSASYGNGERARLTPTVRDVAHEYGCSWTSTDDTRARAWVFAPPVTTARARELRRAADGPGCRALSQAPSFGRPGVAVRCVDGDRVRVALSGLFGDAWLSCELEVERGGAGTGLVDQTGQWCVTVAQAASASTG